MKLCGWEIFDVPISTTVFIKEFLGHYGEINLSKNKNQTEIIKAAKYRREQEYEQLYTLLIESLTT